LPFLGEIKLKYCIWNNKGGVGKSFLTYSLATEYAIQKQDEIVVVADLCPQANVSEMLLGGNGKGQENQFKLADEGRSIAGYIKDRFHKSRYEKLGTESNYFVQIKEYNDFMPKNLFLLSGDFELDLASTLVSRIESDPIKEAPSRAMSLLKDVLNSFEEANKNKKVTFFIDCNPSFAIYTELAILASDRLIVPCTGDFASFRGANNVVKTLFGITDENQKDSIFTIVDFSSKVKSLKIILPKLYLGIINKSRTYDTNSTRAYKAHVKNIENYFEGLKSISENVSVMSIKDCNNIALVVNHNGIPISKLEPKKYQVYDIDSQVNKDQVDAFMKDINSVLDKL
jgi:cellulose biosynthesis protein BcsQ